MSLAKALSAIPAVLILSLFQLEPASGQVYMHVPAGSNNRLNEATDTVTTEGRLFNGQNNRRGGYNVGDRTDKAFAANNPYVTDLTTLYNPEDTTTTGQYEMQYFEGSKLQIQWMNERGCGTTDPTATDSNANSVNCELIVQFLCENGANLPTGQGFMTGSEFIRNGGNTKKPAVPTTAATIASTKTANDAALIGRHESEQYYYECSKRSRNKGLFTSTAQLGGDTAIYTRQNPTGAQSGLECPEERDYYPYWSPSPWKDIAILTDHAATFCLQGKYTDASQNNHKVYKCVPTVAVTDAKYDAQLNPITEADCTKAGGQWTPFTGGLPAPDCLQAPWSKDDHLGSGIDGSPLAYDWILPKVADLQAAGIATYAGPDGSTMARCVTRVRYNVTTDEFDPYEANASSNGALLPATTGISASTNKPVISLGTVNGQSVNVQVNLDAKGVSLTYEDRSHTFYIRSRPQAYTGKNIVNLNTRGKRCNIVQCFPAVEYDFAPHNLTVTPDTLVHVQWTGSNTNNNNAGAGTDGQDGSAGEGAANTDRQSIAQVEDLAGNYPLPLDKNQVNMWSTSTCYKPSSAFLSGATNAQQPSGFMIKQAADGTVTARNDAATECAMWLMTSGQIRTIAQSQAQAAAINPTLDNAPASLIGGVVMQFNGVQSTATPQTYYYIATRNNNFTNRGEKGVLIVDPQLKSVTGSKAQS